MMTLLNLVPMALLVPSILAFDAAPQHSWVFETSKEWGYVHMSSLEQVPNGPLVAAWQASRRGEGDDDQAILIKTSNDGGDSWAVHRVAIKHGFAQAVWGPALQWDHIRHEMVLFFSASVPQNRRSAQRSYPGGDIFLTRSKDLISWSAPQLLLPYSYPQGSGNVSKVTANKVRLPQSTWLIVRMDTPAVLARHCVHRCPRNSAGLHTRAPTVLLRTHSCALCCMHAAATYRLLLILPCQPFPPPLSP